MTFSDRNLESARRLTRTYVVAGERMTAAEVWDRYVGTQSPEEFMRESDGGVDNIISAACAYVAAFPAMFGESAGDDEGPIAHAIEDYLAAALGR